MLNCLYFYDSSFYGGQPKDLMLLAVVASIFVPILILNMIQTVYNQIK